MNVNTIIDYITRKIKTFFYTLTTLIGIFVLFFMFYSLFDLIGDLDKFTIQVGPNAVGAALNTLFLYAIYNLVKPYEENVT